MVWGEEERSDNADRASQQLGLHLGFASTRPEKLYGTGPDNLWALSAGRQAVVELKTGCTTNTIARKDMDQLHTFSTPPLTACARGAGPRGERRAVPEPEKADRAGLRRRHR
ncbi:hypothetical protein AB0E27_32255 [Streptomyces sparsogenes]|uniref:hypothetical protein n=1 Tax=Streptomyces sparsogenes TaxID=67365 RepID=UPI0033E89EA0